jgi:hypothetical protein
LQVLGILFTNNFQLLNELLISITFQDAQFFIDCIFNLKLLGKIFSLSINCIGVTVACFIQFLIDLCISAVQVGTISCSIRFH